MFSNQREVTALRNAPATALRVLTTKNNMEPVVPAAFKKRSNALRVLTTLCLMLILSPTSALALIGQRPVCRGCYVQRAVPEFDFGVFFETILTRLGLD